MGCTKCVTSFKFNFFVISMQQQSLVNINVLQNNMRYSRYNGHVTALYSCCILNKQTVERVCALFDQQLRDPSLGSSFAARRGKGTVDFPMNWIRVVGFDQKLYSYDAMIAGALKSFWYV